jgi:hypothetical protein
MSGSASEQNILFKGKLYDITNFNPNEDGLKKSPEFILHNQYVI